MFQNKKLKDVKVARLVFTDNFPWVSHDTFSITYGDLIYF